MTDEHCTRYWHGHGRQTTQLPAPTYNSRAQSQQSHTTMLLLQQDENRTVKSSKSNLVMIIKKVTYVFLFMCCVKRSGASHS